MIYKSHKQLKTFFLKANLRIMYSAKELMKFVENQSGTYRNFSQNFTEIALSGYILGF